MHPTTHLRTSEQSLTFSRQFDAPVAAVVRAHTDPEQFSHWMGPSGTSCRLDRFAAHTGGAFDYTITGNGEWRFFGSYHEVGPTRIVHTWEFAGDPGLATLEVLSFVDLGQNRCRLDGQSLYTTAKHCAETLAFDESGAGMEENFSRLDQLLAHLTS
ncbi:MAG TPA: SRPBCC domain-containing protein [Ilumatobacteraceae bacterium]|nr:SRPBCC domain-containing protein [Ilumatobacteraceae bacterium]